MKRLDNTQRIKRTVALAMFAALAYAVHFVHIPVGFLNLDFKDVVITVCGMYFGPISGMIVAIVVPLLEFITVSSTGVYGLLMNVFGSVTFVGTASIIYKFKKTLTGAVVGLVSAAFAMTAVMIGANLLITPYYMGVGLSDVAALIPTLLLPFNAVKAILNASLTLCLYKPLTSVLKKTGFAKNVLEGKDTNKRHSVIVWIIGGLIAVTSLCIIFFVLGGKIDFF